MLPIRSNLQHLREEVEEEEDILTLLALVYLRAKRKKNNKKRKHKYWVSPRLEGRNDHGTYKHLVKELDLDCISFQKYFRLTREQFKQVLPY